MKIKNEHLREEILKIIHKEGISGSAVAAKAGIAKRTVYRILNLENEESQIETATTIAKAFGWRFELPKNKGGRIIFIDPDQEENKTAAKLPLPPGLALLKADKKLRESYGISDQDIRVTATARFVDDKQNHFTKSQWLEIALIVKR